MMSQFDWEQIRFLLDQNGKRYLIALGILIGGFVIGLIIRHLVGKVTESVLKTEIAKPITKGRETFPQEAAKWVRQILFYSLMFFVGLTFLKALHIPGLVEPLDQFQSRLIHIANWLSMPLALFVCAWLVATLLRVIINNILRNPAFQTQIEKLLHIEKTQQSSFAFAVSNTAYWLVYLVFSVLILESLQLQGMIDPLKDSLQRVVNYLPNLIGAFLILSVGWFLARILQKVMTGLFHSVGADAFGQKIGLSSGEGSRSLSHILGTITYVLILIPVFLASMNTLEFHVITDPAKEMLNEVLSTVPNVFAAIIAIILAYFIGKILSGLLTNILTNAGFNSIPSKLGFGKIPTDYNQLLGKMGIGDRETQTDPKTPSELMGSLLFIIILLFTGIQALDLIGFHSLATIFKELVSFVGHILSGFIIFGIALFIANIVSSMILSTGSTQARLFALCARIAILALAAALALQHLGLAEQLINLTFGILLGGITLALALSFGIGGQHVAGQILKDLHDSIKRKK